MESAEHSTFFAHVERERERRRRCVEGKQEEHGGESIEKEGEKMKRAGEGAKGALTGWLSCVLANG